MRSRCILTYMSVLLDYFPCFVPVASQLLNCTIFEELSYSEITNSPNVVQYLKKVSVTANNDENTLLFVDGANFIVLIISEGDSREKAMKTK